jgi:arylsulfatase B
LVGHIDPLNFPESGLWGRILPAMIVPILIFISLLVGSSSGANAAVKPNIVFILADDLGWADVGYHGGYIKTPNIDRLAREGVELDSFYVAPMCSPTRAGLLTGRYPIRFGLARAVIPPWRNFGLDTGEITLAVVLGKAGYAHRGAFGKWHLGHHDPKWHPLARGFTHFHGHYNGAIDYFTHEREGERDWHVNYEPSDEQGYSTDLIADGAANFIKEHSKDGPYFCYVPFNAPHSPFQVPAKYLQQYAHLGNAKTANAKGGRKIAGHRKQILAAMTAWMKA